MASRSVPFTDGYDEAFDASGAPRAHYARVLARIEELGAAAVRDRVAARLAEREVVFSTASGPAPFVVDPVPRVLTTAEWDVLSAGIAQRVLALEAFVHDAYGERRSVAEGVVPEAAIETAEGYEPQLSGRLPAGHLIGVAGLDIVRDADGAFLVLEDNLRTPSGYAYAAAARAALEEDLDHLAIPFARDAYAAIADAIAAAAPAGREHDLAAVLLTDGPANSAYYEHGRVARRVGIPLVTLADLERRGEELFHAGARVDVVYRRTDEDRAFHPGGGGPTSVGALLVEPWLAGRLGLVNGYGTGVADDKAIHAHVEDLIRLFLGEEPLLGSVHTYDLTDPACLKEALERIDELVVKPRLGHGGHGVVVCAHARPEDVRRAAAAIEAEPTRWVAQPTIALSLIPTVTPEGGLAPRHVDLRPFAFQGTEGVRVPPGGLTRVALGAGALVVNSSQAGGGKDTWVMP